MNSLHKTAALLLLASATLTSFAQNQNLFIPNLSTGADGPFVPGPGTTNVVLPADGRLNFTYVHISASATVRFIRNAANTPAYMLASQGITNHGLIDISGETGTSLRGGFPGPGGYAGGEPGTFGSQPGDGHGPGAGAGGATPGKAAYGTVPSFPVNPLHGQTYGSPILIPLIGGSGGGGTANVGGGGGGGALLLASSTIVTNSGRVRAWGGASAGIGSGGAVRVLAPVISGSGSIDVAGFNTTDGNGRISCEMIDRSSFGFSLQPAGPHVVTTNYIPFAFPPTLPSLRVVSVGGVDIPAGAPAGFAVTLPINAQATQPIVIEASGFSALVDIDLRVTPSSGPALPLLHGQIDNTVDDPATVIINATLPANVPLTVNAWTH